MLSIVLGVLGLAACAAQPTTRPGTGVRQPAGFGVGARPRPAIGPDGKVRAALLLPLSGPHAAVGEAMPSFLLPDVDGHLTTLDEVLADGPAVISFNRGHWCSFCRIELTTLAAAQPRIAELGSRIVSIMPDREAFIRRLPARILERVRILLDMDNSYAMSLGLAIWVGEALTALMRERRLCLDEFQGNATWMLPLPATFVVARDGIVHARFVDPDFRSRMEIDDIVAALRRIA